MARLTWQEVSSPDFGSSMSGMKNAFDSFDRGFERAGQTIDQYDAAQTAAQSNAIMANVLQLGSPEEAAAALASGQLTAGVDPRRINAAAFAAMSGREGNLQKIEADRLGLISDGQRLESDAMKLGREKVSNDDYMYANSAEVRPIINEFARLSQMTGPEGEAGMADLMAKNPDVFKRLPVDAIRSLITGGQGIRQTEFGFDNAYRNDARGETDRQLGFALDNEYTTNYQSDEGEGRINREKDAIIAKYTPLYGAEGANRLYNGLLSRVRGESQVGSGAPGGAASGGGGGYGGGGAGGAPSSYGGKPMQTQWAVQNSQENISAINDVAAELGYKPEDLAMVMSYETGGKFDPGIKGGKGGNHRGLIQFGESERAQFGYRDGMSFAEQMRGPVKAYLKARGKNTTSLQDLYSTINAGSPGLYNRSDSKDKSGKRVTVADHVAKMQAQHGGNALAFLGKSAPTQGQGFVRPPAAVADPLRSVAFTTMANNVAMSQDEFRPIVQDFLEVKDSRLNQTQVARQLTGKGGTFEGANPDAIMPLLKKLQGQGYGVGNVALAGKILANARTGRKGYFESLGNVFAEGGGIMDKIDWDKAKSLAKVATDREFMGNMADVTVVRARAVAESQAGMQLVAQLRAAQKTDMEQAAGRGISSEPARLRWEQKIADAEAKLGAAVGTAERTGSLGQGPRETGTAGSNKTRQAPAPVAARQVDRAMFAAAPAMIRRPAPARVLTPAEQFMAAQRRTMLNR